jgi:hypothetical protein
MKPRTSGGPSSPALPASGFPSFVMMQNVSIHLACWQPLANGQRPPPGTASAVPAGWDEPASVTSGPFS